MKTISLKNENNYLHSLLIYYLKDIISNNVIQVFFPVIIEQAFLFCWPL